MPICCEAQQPPYPDASLMFAHQRFGILKVKKISVVVKDLRMSGPGAVFALNARENRTLRKCSGNLWDDPRPSVRWLDSQCRSMTAAWQAADASAHGMPDRPTFVHKERLIPASDPVQKLAARQTGCGRTNQIQTMTRNQCGCLTSLLASTPRRHKADQSKAC